MQKGENWFIIKAMRRRMPALLLVALLLGACGPEPEMDFQASDAARPPPLIEVYEPLNGDTLPAGEEFVVDYAVLRGESGAYVEISVDGKPPRRIKGVKGRHRMEGLAPGRHRLQIVEYDSKGKPTGGVALIELSAR